MTKKVIACLGEMTRLRAGDLEGLLALVRKLYQILGVGHKHWPAPSARLSLETVLENLRGKRLCASVIRCNVVLVLCISLQRTPQQTERLAFRGILSSLMSFQALWNVSNSCSLLLCMLS